MPVILRLEDFGLELKRDAVSYIIEFVYRGEVNIPGERLTDVCQVEILTSVFFFFFSTCFLIPGGAHARGGGNGAPAGACTARPVPAEHVERPLANCR